MLDPRNGEILSLANWPPVQAERFGDLPAYARQNRAVGASYEPGSTFKPFTVAGAIKEKLITPSTLFHLGPTIQVADREIRESHSGGGGTLTTADILAQSSNVGTVTIGLRMGGKRFDKWVRRFGFGGSTGIDIPGEASGIVPKPKDYSGSSMGNLPIGPGLAVTPMQMAAAYQAIANGGVMRPPHVIQGKSGPARRVISRPVAAQVSRMLEGVLGAGGTAREANIDGYVLAGKTAGREGGERRPTRRPSTWPVHRLRAGQEAAAAGGRDGRRAQGSHLRRPGRADPPRHSRRSPCSRSLTCGSHPDSAIGAATTKMTGQESAMKHVSLMIGDRELRRPTAGRSTASTRSPAMSRRARLPHRSPTPSLPPTPPPRAFPAWAATGPGERRMNLLKAADLLDAKGAEFSALMTAECGAIGPWGHFNSHFAASLMREAAVDDHADRRRGDPVRQAGQLRDGDPPAGRRRARHRAVERAGHPGRARDRDAARLRQHGRPQGVRDVPGDPSPDRHDHARGRPAARRRQCRHQCAGRRRRRWSRP